MQKLHDQANEMALYLCSSIERWKLTGFEYQFLQKRRDIDYATRSRHPRREAWLEVEVARRDRPVHAHRMRNSTRNPKSPTCGQNPNPLRRFNSHYALTRENNLVDLMVVLGKHQAIRILRMESRYECAADSDPVEFSFPVFHILGPYQTKRSLAIRNSSGVKQYRWHPSMHRRSASLEKCFLPRDASRFGKFQCVNSSIESSSQAAFRT